jgi:hypothetical protein
MPRIYRTKGDKALAVKLSIPLTPTDMERLELHAAAQQVGKTEYARRAILATLS